MADEPNAQGTVKIEDNVLKIAVPLLQRHGKILAKGLLFDAMNVVDEFFFILKQKQLHDEGALAASRKRVIDNVLQGKKNGNGGLGAI
jgi:ABC-type uncharacterized transport system YnjBCD ATPase subunit